MKNIKRLIFILAISTMLICTLSVSAAAAMTVSTGDVEVYAGETVTVPVKVSSNAGFVSASVIVEYDDSVLTLTGVNDKALISGAAHTTRFTSPYILSWENDIRASNYTVNGTLAELVFTVSSFAEPGDYDITVSTPTHGILDSNGDKVDCSFSVGTITVLEEECSHDWNDWKKSSRTRHKRSCDLCGEVEYDSHDWDDGEVTEEPTEEYTGVMTYTCDICDATKTDTIPALEPETIPATAITLTPSNLILTKGNSTSITVTLTPADSTDTVTWTSSNESIVTVDKYGMVTAIAEGTATITARANDTVSETCTVRVEKTPCTHTNTTMHPAVSSTCITLGNKLYYTCNDCPMVFKADGKTETTVEAETLTEYGDHAEAVPATCTTQAVCEVCGEFYGELAAHDYKTEWNQGNEKGHWHDCTNCSAHDEQQAHIPGAEATEETAQTCTECGYVIAPATGHIKHTADTSKWLKDETHHWHMCVDCDEKLDVEEHHGGMATCIELARCEICAQSYGKFTPENHADALVYVEAVAATCTESGTVAHWNCAACNKNFNNESGTDVLESIEIPVDADNHVNTEVRDAVEATKESEGYTGDTYCLDCGEKIADGEVIPVITFTYGDVNEDGKITVSDAILIFRYIDGGFELNVFNENAADVNVDGKITVSDAIMILRYIDGGFDVELGVAK